MPEPKLTQDDARTLYRFMAGLARRAGLDAHLAEIKDAPEGLDVALTKLHYLANPEDMPRAIAFTCPKCGATSHHPTDEREGYCGNCHAFTGEGAQLTTAEALALHKYTTQGIARQADLEAALAKVQALAHPNERSIERRVVSVRAGTPFDLVVAEAERAVRVLERWAAKGEGEELNAASELIAGLVATLEHVESAATLDEAHQIASEARALFEGR